MNLLSFLFRRRPMAMPCTPPAPQDDTVAQEEEPPLHGCGWFESSHDLHEGLCVQEHSGADPLARLLPDLPLASWLDLQLAGWRVIQAA